MKVKKPLNTKIFIPYGDKKLLVPSKIGHKYIPIEAFPIEELSKKFSNHRRLRVFFNKGLKCVSCDKVGKYLITGKDNGGHIHIDLYTDKFELMTIDHIKPKSKGGDDNLENLDPMCSCCNSKKSNKFELEG